MGAGCSRHILLKENLTAADWANLYTADWRSERSRELDRYGGPGRSAVARGDSVTAKLNFLETGLRQEQHKLKVVLDIQDDEQKRREAAVKATQERNAAIAEALVLHTDARAVARRASDGTASIAESGFSAYSYATSNGGGSKDFTLLQKEDLEARRRVSEQRKRMIEYAKGVNVAKGVPLPKPLNLPEIRSKVATNWNSAKNDNSNSDDEGDDSPEAREAKRLAAQPPPAEWRVRLHQARRRTMLVVAAMSKWQLAMTQRAGPKRLPRVSSFSYYIPKVLGEEAPRFIEEAKVVAKIQADAAAKYEREQQGLNPQSAQPSEAGHDQESFSGNGGVVATEAGLKDSSPMPRPPPRRGMSDSGTTNSAVVAAATAAVNAAVAAVGIGGGGGALTGMPQLPLGGKGKDLHKSSSGKSISSLPDLRGHQSDAEAGNDQARRGSRKNTPTLPAIGSRPLLNDGELPPPNVPTAPRLPRSMLDRPGDSTRTGRRQSDSAVAAAMLPASIAAAAAAGAAVLTGGSGGGAGGGSAIDRRGVRGQLRPRASDNGVSRVRQREGMGAGSDGGVGGSLFMANLAAGGGSLAGFPQHRRSDAGTSGLTTMSSAPTDGFLPPIERADKPAANGAKAMSLAQARRQALLTDVGNNSGGGDDGGLSARTNMSPSRLGPLKLSSGGGTGAPSNGRAVHSRSPEKLAVGSPSVANPPGVGGSILDGLRQSRDAAALLNREFKEALVVAAAAVAGGPLPVPPGAAAAAAAAAGNSPPHSPAGDRGRSIERGNGGGGGGGGGGDGVAAALSSPRTSGQPPADGSSGSSAIAGSASGGSSSGQGTPSGASAGAGAPGSGPAPPSGRPTPPLTVVTTSTSDLGPSSVSPNTAAAGPATPLAGPVPPPGPPPANPPPARPSHLLSAGATASTPGGGAGPRPTPPPGGPPPVTRNISITRNQPPPPPPGVEGEAAARMFKAQQLMGMYANRVNAQWAESQQWAPPTVLPSTEQEWFCASDAWVPYKVNVLRLLKQGGIAVHIDACADAVPLADGSTMDIWTSCPWQLVQALRPGSLPMSERLEGVPVGARVLQQLVLALEVLAGKDAVTRLQVILAINDDQRNAVVADVIRSRSYGLKPENLILTAQRKRCGYRYDREAQAFLEDPASPAAVLGSGYSLCQLAWLGDAFYVSKDGELNMLMGKTLLERFATVESKDQTKVEWLVWRRARDLSLLTPEGILDLPQLAYSLYTADVHSGNMVTQAALASSLTIPRAYDSTLLALKNPSPPPAKAAPGVPVAASAAGAAGVAAAAAASQQRISVAAAGAGIQGGGGAAGVIDLRAAELSSPLMVEALAAVRKRCGHDGWVGLQRYFMHVPTLHNMLNTLGIFRPKLTMNGDVARLSLDAADITADPRLGCVAVQTRTNPAILSCPNEVDDLIPLLLSQDRSTSFRDIVAANLEAGAGSNSESGGAGALAGPQLMCANAAKPGQRILVYIAANDVTQLAVNLVLLMARPGRDVVHLVTVVHTSLQLAAGQQLVLRFLKQLSNAMIETHVEVLVKGINGLLDVMESAATKLAPNLVVMASAALTMSNLNTASVMGSVTLSVLKRLSLPVAVVTSNSKHLVLTQRRTALRTMAVVESTARPTLTFLCTQCMEPMRGDKLVLAAYHPTRQMTSQQQQTQRRLLENFADVASSHHFHTAYRMQLDGPLEKAVAAAVEDEPVHLVGLQVPAGTKAIPGHVLGLIRACRGGVLVYRDTQ
ncbi:hypothetical protein HYH02_002798 [Chlamydomonas schloesseri]|uniref:Uncharacterized protein n=1 Tax=Chlamydomonas schloesseri TaxID=2026947 RepID=A0A835WS20_9CHLO|nr:hypothetical protein HYH02_002798 [Chlamydomonas schloesseri]|eukprot:KAG2452561.1 hypothetical protein HYH02_002798 [Chlamydomonas schloesseri]